MSELSSVEAETVRRKFKFILAEHFQMLLPTATDFATATRFLDMPKTGLRGGDAFHLAIAANREAKKILTLDQGFIKAGKLLKLPVSAGIH